MEDYTPTKRCIDCGEEKPRSQFYKNKKMSDGYLRYCKICQATREGRQYKYKNCIVDDKKRCTKCYQWFEMTSEFWLKQQQCTGGFSSVCKKCYNIAQQIYRAQHPEYIAYQKDWSKRNPEKRIAAVRRYMTKYPDRVKSREKKYNESEHGKAVQKAKTARRVARIANAAGVFTPVDVKKQYAIQNGKCYWCAKKLRGKYHVDHIIPLARGGSNWPDNICCSCPRCNTSRQDKLPEEWGRLF